jgi:hypothetical protein
MGFHYVRSTPHRTGWRADWHSALLI